MQLSLRLFFLLIWGLTSSFFGSEENKTQVFSDNLVASIHQEHLQDHPQNSSISCLEQYQPSLAPDCEPLAIVGDCVNVITGQFFKSEKDLHDTSIDPLHFVRHYDSASQTESCFGLGFGSNFAIFASDIEEGSRHHYGMINTRENVYLLYRDKEKGPSRVCFIEPHLFERGYTNSSQMSGKKNLVNWKAVFRFKERQPEWVVQLGDGTKRYYRKPVKLGKFFRSKVGCLTETAYLLEKEIKPNGNFLLFDYVNIDGNPFLKTVKTRNRADTATLSQLTFDYREDQTIISDANGHQVTYRTEEMLLPHRTGLGIRILPKKILREVHPSQEAKATRYGLKTLLWSVNRIEDGEQSTRVEYDSRGKVAALYQRQDSTDESLLYRFNYHSNSTDVFDALITGSVK